MLFRRLGRRMRRRKFGHASQWRGGGVADRGACATGSIRMRRTSACCCPATAGDGGNIRSASERSIRGWRYWACTDRPQPADRYPLGHDLMLAEGSPARWRNWLRLRRTSFWLRATSVLWGRCCRQLELGADRVSGSPTDAVGAGFVDSLSVRPGGNATGFLSFRIQA